MAAWGRAAEQIERDITAGRFHETGRLPTEGVLAAELGLSRHILRQAIAALVRKGRLRTVPHTGIFIAPQRVEFGIGPSTRLSDALLECGFSARRLTLSRRICTPTPRIAEKLAVARRTEVLEIVRLIHANDIPLAYNTFWFPADRFHRAGQLLEASGSLRRALSQIGINIYNRRDIAITSRYSVQAERKWLQLRARAIVMSMAGHCVDTTGEPTHAFDYSFNAERIALLIAPK